MSKEINSFAETMSGLINTFGELSSESGEITAALNSLHSQSETVKDDYAKILSMTEKLHTEMLELKMLSKKKVLVIDDDETTLTMTKSALKNDYNVTTANSGKAALNMFLEGYTPHLILLDLYMPETGGWDTFIRIRNLSRLHQTLIAIYTTSENPEDKAKAKEFGAVEYIHKPLSVNELSEKIAKLID
jgi:CheY-like chemotaxis protein